MNYIMSARGISELKTLARASNFAVGLGADGKTKLGYDPRTTAYRKCVQEMSKRYFHDTDGDLYFTNLPKPEALKSKYASQEYDYLHNNVYQYLAQQIKAGKLAR